MRITEGDTVRVMRGEFKGVTGKITKVSTENNGAAIEGIKKEKLKGGNVDVFIHTSNLLVTDLNTEDKWRQNKLEGKKPKEAKEKQVEPQEPQQEKQPAEGKPKETKVTKEKLKKSTPEADVKLPKKEKDTKQKNTKSKKVSKEDN